MRTFSGNGHSTTEKYLLDQNLPALSNLRAYTIVGWIYCTSYGDGLQPQLWSKGLYEPRKISAFLDNSSVVDGITAFISGPGADFAFSRTAVGTAGLNRWLRIVHTFDVDGDKTIHLYVNGVEPAYDFVFSLSGNAVPDDTAIGWLFARYKNPGAGADIFGFEGKMADLRIYKRAWTPQEVANDYAGLFIPTPDAWWKLCGDSPELNLGVLSSDVLDIGIGGSPFALTDAPLLAPDAVCGKRLELEGLRLHAHELGSQVFSFATFNMGGSPGMADTHFEVQGYRLKAHDNGDGTFSPVVTTSTGVDDVTVEMQGLRFKLHPTGETVSIGGTLYPLYAVVTFSI